MKIDIKRARTETPGVKNRIHFNNCGASLMPSPVLNSIKGHLDLEAEIGGYEAAKASSHLIEDTYDFIARLLNCSPDEIAERTSINQALEVKTLPFPIW